METQNPQNVWWVSESNGFPSCTPRATAISIHCSSRDVHHILIFPIRFPFIPIIALWDYPEPPDTTETNNIIRLNRLPATPLWPLSGLNLLHLFWLRLNCLIFGFISLLFRLSCLSFPLTCPHLSHCYFIALDTLSILLELWDCPRVGNSGLFPTSH